jgi:mercuric ion binding protein
MRYLFLVLALLSLSFAKVVALHVEGMTCPLCTMAIKKSLKKVKGVTKVKVRLNTKKATVHFKKGVKKEALLQAIKDVGYSAKIISVKEE